MSSIFTFVECGVPESQSSAYALNIDPGRYSSTVWAHRQKEAFHKAVLFSQAVGQTPLSSRKTVKIHTYVSWRHLGAPCCLGSHPLPGGGSDSARQWRLSDSSQRGDEAPRREAATRREFSPRFPSCCMKARPRPVSPHAHSCCPLARSE